MQHIKRNGTWRMLAFSDIDENIQKMIKNSSFFQFQNLNALINFDKWGEFLEMQTFLIHKLKNKPNQNKTKQNKTKTKTKMTPPAKSLLLMCCITFVFSGWLIVCTSNHPCTTWILDIYIVLNTSTQIISQIHSFSYHVYAYQDVTTN